jgi:predicted kinase
MKAIDIIEHIDGIINEGVYDLSIFKAIFAAGGSGSGKGFITSKVTGGLGYKVINSDDLFEFLMKKSKISLKLAEVPQDVFIPVRDKAKKITDRKQSMHLDGRLGVIIDGTAANLGTLQKQKKMLEDMGYDTYMVFVNTSLDVAMARNKERERSVPDDVVKEKWEEVQDNIDKLKGEFGSNFFLIDNNKPLEKDDKVINATWKQIMMLSKKKPKNPKAVEWIENELTKKKRK